MKIYLSIILVLTCTLVGLGLTNPDYSGEWTLDLAKSKTSDKMPFPALSKTIDQNAVKLEVLNDSAIKKVFPDSNLRPITYPLDGSKGTFSFNSGINETQVDTQASFDPNRNLQIVKTYRTLQNQSLRSETTTTELWQLIDQANTLKISSVTKEAEQSYAFELVYTKTGTGSIADLDSKTSNKQQQKADGIINGRAIRLVTPPYPPEARKTKAQGNVFVEVLIDEKGNVVLAKTIAGNSALTAVSQQSAMLCKFSPTKIKGVPASVTGVIFYSFIKQ